MKCAVIGGVQSTAVLVKALHRHSFQDVRVWGYEPKETELVSGWADLKTTANKYSYPYNSFLKVTECESQLVAFAPDVVFVVGLSQIVPSSMLEVATFLNVGFHPTALPKGRGRAAIAWLILNRSRGAATFFELQQGMDDGAILVQEPFEVSDDDYAFDVEEKILRAEEKALDRWLPQLKQRDVKPFPQDHEEASWLGRRSPEDGWIDWSQSSSEILKIVRASSKPHPGAYTFFGDIKVYIWRASRFNRNVSGVTGRILFVEDNNSFVVQTEEGLLLIEEWTADENWSPRVGMKLGYYLELENYKLKKKVQVLEERLLKLESRILQ